MAETAFQFSAPAAILVVDSTDASERLVEALQSHGHSVACAKRGHLVSGDVRRALPDTDSDCLAWCQSKGPVYLISDTFTLTGNFLRTIMKGDEILQHFTYLFFSDEIGIKKPNPYAFQQICTRESCPADKIVYVGDDLEVDYGAAQAAGAHFILFGTNVSVSSSPVQSADSFAALLELFEGRAANRLPLSK